MKFNVNDYVKVKLTKTGYAELKRQAVELRKVWPTMGEYKPPVEDENGWSKWQLHTLMNTFGHLMTLGFNPPFETNIDILER